MVDPGGRRRGEPLLSVRGPTAAAGVVGGGAVATLGGSLVQIAVAALAVGVVALAIAMHDRREAGGD